MMFLCGALWWLWWFLNLVLFLYSSFIGSRHARRHILGTAALKTIKPYILIIYRFFCDVDQSWQGRK